MARSMLLPSIVRPTAARRPVAEIAVLGSIAVLLAIDLVADASRTSPRHVLMELAAAIVLLAAAATLLVRSIASHRILEGHVGELEGRLKASGEEAERWRLEARQALEGLGAAIDRQCDRWGLTDAERAIALLLLKGLSMKEIAEARGTSERTVRQQALAVYRKAGLEGRAELSAFFLEDLLLPSETPRPDAVNAVRTDSTQPGSRPA